MIGGTISSRPFRDDEELWPKKDGSLFPHRIKLSQPLFKGRVKVSGDLANQIRFMKGKVWSGTGRIDLLCLDKSGHFVVVELKKGEAPNKTLLQILRYMSWVRQHLANGKEVKGIILTESVDSSLVEIVKEVPNVYIRLYRVAIELL